MGKKILTRICNLLYLGAAGFAIYSLATKPLIDINLKVSLTGEQISALIPNSGGDSGNTQAAKREGTSMEDLMSNPAQLLSKVDEISVTLPVQIKAEVCFDYKNPQVLNDIIDYNVDYLLTSVVNELTPKLTKIIEDVALEVASSVLEEQINAQIANVLNIQGDLGEDAISTEQVNEILGNVFDTLNDGPTKPSELMDVLVGEVKYVQADPQPTSTAQIQDGGFYTLSNEEYVETKTFSAGTTYYVKDGYTTGILSILDDLSKQEGSNIDMEEITENLSQFTESIEETMVEVMGSIPGLTETKYTVATGLTQQDYEASLKDGVSEKFYVLEGEEYVPAEGAFDGSKTYYSGEVYIKDIASALTGLLGMLGGGEEPQQQVQEAKREETATTDSETTEQIKQLLLKYIPLESITSMDLSLGGYAGYILLGYMGLLMFPWALFALVTFFRTLRPRKCWTKPWIVFFFGFLQLIFGAVLTYGIQFGLPLLMPTLSGLIPAPYNALLEGITLSITTNMFIPSLIYAGMIVFTIIYAIIAHGAKKDLKQYKKDKRAAKKAGLSYKEYMESKGE